MSDDTPSIEILDTEIISSDDLVWQGYGMIQLAGKTCVMPTAFEGVKLPLAMMQKPDYSMAVDKTGGVRIILFRCFQFLKFLISIILFRLKCRLGHISLSPGQQKSYIVLRSVNLLRQGLTL